MIRKSALTLFLVLASNLFAQSPQMSQAMAIHEHLKDYEPAELESNFQFSCRGLASEEMAANVSNWKLYTTSVGKDRIVVCFPNPPDIEVDRISIHLSAFDENDILYSYLGFTRVYRRDAGEFFDGVISFANTYPRSEIGHDIYESSEGYQVMELHYLCQDDHMIVKALYIVTPSNLHCLSNYLYPYEEPFDQFNFFKSSFSIKR